MSDQVETVGLKGRWVYDAVGRVCRAKDGKLRLGVNIMFEPFGLEHFRELELQNFNFDDGEDLSRLIDFIHKHFLNQRVWVKVRKRVLFTKKKVAKYVKLDAEIELTTPEFLRADLASRLNTIKATGGG